MSLHNNNNTIIHLNELVEIYHSILVLVHVVNHLRNNIINRDYDTVLILDGYSEHAVHASMNVVGAKLPAKICTMINRDCDEQKV